jgi:adenylate cyclase
VSLADPIADAYPKANAGRTTPRARSRGPRSSSGRSPASSSCSPRPRPTSGTEHPDWPRFRIEVNSGEAMVGIVGARGKSSTVVGDTVNVAARLEGAAPVGGIATGAGTLRCLPGARVRNLGPGALKDKRTPVEAYVLETLD